MSLRCVEMSLFSSVKLSQFCLFSYTFRLRSSFINIFFSQCSLPPRLCPSVATMGLPLRRIICPAFSASVWAFVLSSGRPGGGAALPTRPHPPKGKPEPRCLVNRNPGGFPTRRKKVYKWTALFPAGRKPGVAGCQYSAPLAPSHRGRRRGKDVETPGSEASRDP